MEGVIFQYITKNIPVAKKYNDYNPYFLELHPIQVKELFHLTLGMDIQGLHLVEELDYRNFRRFIRNINSLFSTINSNKWKNRSKRLFPCYSHICSNII